MMKKTGCLVLYLISFHGRADTLVVPTKYEQVDAPGAGGIFPQAINQYQEVFDASNFSSLPGEVLITGFSWRLDNPPGGGANIDFVLPSVEVLVSTTSRNSSSLSPVFSNNTGADEITARPAAPLRLSGVKSPGGPSAFSIAFPFINPFKYDPNKGNLLLELKVINGVRGVPNLDWSEPSGNEGVAFIDKSSPFGADPYGPITQFSYQSIPEPCGIFLIGIATTLVLFKRPK
jgi:hypothetical protein